MAKSWTKKLRARQGEEPPAAVQVVVVPDVPEDNEPEPPRLQESFTVQLGTQQKAQHNMRLLSASALHLCRIMESGRGGELPAERLSTAMSLYSQSLHGVVLLVDKGINSFTGIKKEFGALCEKSTDFHFPSLEEQLKQLHVDLMNAPTPVLPEEDEGAKPRPPSPSAELKHGDFYVTRHSNLAECHVVFHLVGDAEAANKDMSTRSQVIVGLRNVFRCAFNSEVNHLTLPLLMVHQLTEEMDDRWCLRRAELVLKCIKGFVMENSVGYKTEAKTVQFLVPEETSWQMFDAYSNLFSNIFRLASAMSFQS